MILWIALTAMIALAVCGLTMALVRRYDAHRLDGSGIDILRSQLSDIDAQHASGALTEQEADGLRAEIKRRLLNEARIAELPARPLPSGTISWIAVALSAVVALSAAGLYATMGQPDLVESPKDNPVSAPQQAASEHPIGDVATMIAQLEAQMQRTPDDAEGWRMLGWSYMQVDRAKDAAAAYARAVALAPANADYLSAEGEALARADGGRVGDAAVKVFRAALAISPQDPRSRYFLAVRKDQAGDHQGAMNDWIALLKSAPADAPWAAEVRDFVERSARDHGEDISARLPPKPVPSAAAPGPSADQVAAASQMSVADRNAMIRAMVDKLAGDLKRNPQDAEGWVRLMRARMVLGEAGEASQAYLEARKAFADSPQEQSRLRDAARELQVPGA